MSDNTFDYIFDLNIFFIFRYVIVTFFCSSRRCLLIGLSETDVVDGYHVVYITNVYRNCVVSHLKYFEWSVFPWYKLSWWILCSSISAFFLITGGLLTLIQSPTRNIGRCLTFLLTYRSYESLAFSGLLSNLPSSTLRCSHAFNFVFTGDYILYFSAFIVVYCISTLNGWQLSTKPNGVVL